MSDEHRDEIAKLEALYAENPEGRIFTHLAEAYRKAGDLDRAEDVLTAGLERHPDYSSAHVVLGRVLQDQGRNDEADAEFRQVLEFDGQNLVALRSLGQIARARGRDGEAIEYYERLAELDPSSEETRDALAELRGEKPAQEEPATAWTGEPPADAGAEVAVEDPVEGLEPTAAGDEPAPGGGEPLDGFEQTAAEGVDAPVEDERPAAEAFEDEAPETESFEDAPWATSPADDEDAGDDFEDAGDDLEDVGDEIEWLTGPLADRDAEDVGDAGAWGGEADLPPGADASSGEPVEELSEEPSEEPWAETSEEPAEEEPWAETPEDESVEEPWAETPEEASAEEPWADAPEEASAEEAWAETLAEEPVEEPRAEAPAEEPPEEPVEEPWAETPAEAAESAGPGEPDAAAREPDLEEPWIEEPWAEAPVGEEKGWTSPEEAAADVAGDEATSEAGDEGGAVPPDEPSVLTETFAHVYARQGLYERAAEVYRVLVRTRPDDEALQERLAEMERMAAQAETDDASPEGDSLEGLEPGEVDTAAAEPEPLPGLEPEELEAGTGLAVGATGADADAEPVPDAIEVRDVPEPPEETTWHGAAELEGPGPDEGAGDEVVVEESPWTAADWTSPEEETPYAWTEDESEADTSPPIREYLSGLLDWSGDEAAAAVPETESGPTAEATGPAAAGEAVESASEPSATGASSPEREAGEQGEGDDGGEGDRDDGDDDLDMFRSWLESLKR